MCVLCTFMYYYCHEIFAGYSSVESPYTDNLSQYVYIENTKEAKWETLPTKWTERWYEIPACTSENHNNNNNYRDTPNNIKLFSRITYIRHTNKYALDTLITIIKIQYKNFWIQPKQTKKERKKCVSLMVIVAGCCLYFSYVLYVCRFRNKVRTWWEWHRQPF